ncbi:hypothetical protein F4678DRAFT_460622 [Xylaria arbuscula]|nr:hypothetical protein F4678DRAFT_460622 [Xylaria arbuscula]
MFTIANGSDKFGESSGAQDMKMSDVEVRHVCNRGIKLECHHPNLVIEVGWAQTRKELKDKAEFYAHLSKGEIRTIVVVDMHEIFLAERKNEIRLKRMYRNGEVDESYRYGEDEDNQTGSASTLVWRARKKADGTVEVGNAEEKMFRDLQGNTIQSGSPCIPGHDFICAGIVGTQQGKLKIPLFEVSASVLCERIQYTLVIYREQMARKIKKEVVREEQKNTEKKKKAEERLWKATELRNTSGGALYAIFGDSGGIMFEAAQPLRI